MPISENIKYDFDHIKTGLMAFVANLEIKLQYIIPDLPVFVLQTGDTSYFLTSKFVISDNKEIYLKTPRFVISFEDIQANTEQNTNKYNEIEFQKDGINYITKGRRVAHIISVNTDFVSSNFLKALENYEVFSTITSRVNVFTYEFMGNTYEGAYTLASTSFEKPGMDVNSATRNFSIKTPLELQLHLFIPRLESIKKSSETGFDATEFDLISRGEVDSFHHLNNELFKVSIIKPLSDFATIDSFFRLTVKVEDLINIDRVVSQEVKWKSVSSAILIDENTGICQVFEPGDILITATSVLDETKKDTILIKCIPKTALELISFVVQPLVETVRTVPVTFKVETSFINGYVPINCNDNRVLIGETIKISEILLNFNTVCKYETTVTVTSQIIGESDIPFTVITSDEFKTHLVVNNLIITNESLRSHIIAYSDDLQTVTISTSGAYSQGIGVRLILENLITHVNTEIETVILEVQILTGMTKLKLGQPISLEQIGVEIIQQVSGSISTHYHTIG